MTFKYKWGIVSVGNFHLITGDNILAKNKVAYVNLEMGSGTYYLNGDVYEFVAPPNIPYAEALAYAQLQGRTCRKLTYINVELPLWDNLIDVEWAPVLPELHLYQSRVKRSFYGEYKHIAVVAPSKEVAQIGITEILRETELYPLASIDEIPESYKTIHRISAGFLPYSYSNSKYFRLVLDTSWNENDKRTARPYVWEEVADQVRDIPLGFFKFEGIAVHCVDFNEGHKYKNVVIVAAGIHEAIQAARDLFPEMEEKVSDFRIKSLTGFDDSTVRTISYGGMPLMDHTNTWYVTGANLPESYEPHIGHGDKYIGIQEKRIECIDPVTGEKRVYFTLNRYTMDSYSY